MGVSTAQEIAAIQEYYESTPPTEGEATDWVSRLAADIEEGNIIPGMTLGQMVGVGLDAGGDLSDYMVNPDLVTDTEVQEVVEETYQTTTEGTDIHLDCEAYFTASNMNVSTDAINQALDIIAENEAAVEAGETDGIISDDEALGNLFEICYNMDPVYCAMAMTYQTRYVVAGMLENNAENMEDNIGNMEDLMDDYSHLSTDPEDATQFQLDSQIILQQLTVMQTAFKIEQDISKTINDIYLNQAETVSKLAEAKFSTQQYILQH